MAKAAGGQALVKKQAEPVRSALVRRALLSELGTRDGANPGSPVQIRAIVNELRPAMARRTEENGRLGHAHGTRIAWFFGVRADEVLGRADFAEFLRKDLGLSLGEAYRLVRAAKVATEAQAAWGLSVVLDLASVLDLLASDPSLRRAYKVPAEPGTINDLAGVTFRLADGRELRFDKGPPDAATVETLLGELREKAAIRFGKLSKSDADVNARLREACGTDPRLADVEARIKRTRKGNRFVISLPTGANLDKVTKALSKALEEGSGR